VKECEKLNQHLTQENERYQHLCEENWTNKENEENGEIDSETKTPKSIQHLNLRIDNKSLGSKKDFKKLKINPGRLSRLKKTSKLKFKSSNGLKNPELD